ncbi:MULTISPECIES: NAD(P)H-dependent oxidoreductase [Methylobacillus]|uniref:Kef-type potassium/proton antiporter accessory protein, CPA2 family n=1 Tax=Methylobacillus flagellatus (strain ATCC 51484 / DSM 6875 / VKM B-1610 / KT) TaxID=265072 RepID=Q1GYQ8_METFK|nr:MULTISPECIES: NAD(P)H-dependent oxidoreductase [Methylobacillus]ABE50629.1 Kef-type potassium/proton antiporter accessory protein, CPA2 family [Methylobacillus flagellatus KT]
MVKHRVLVVMAHPMLESSRVNRALLDAAQGCEGIQVHDLYTHYPEQMIDVAHEQALVDTHDILVFQHPMYWYSCPALLKSWFDSVLSYGWAYGGSANKLSEKAWVHTVSTGGSERVYQRRGYNCFSIAELLRPFEQTARLCGMRYLQPFLVQSADTLSDETLQEYAASYAAWLDGLAKGSWPPQVDSLQSEEAHYLAPADGAGAS